MLCERTEPALLNTFTKCTANTESYTLAYGMVVQNCFLIADFDHQLVFIFIFYFKNNQNNDNKKPKQRMLSGTAYSVLLQIWLNHLEQDYSDSVFSSAAKASLGTARNEILKGKFLKIFNPSLMQTRCKFSLTTNIQEQEIYIVRLQVHLALNPIYAND